MMVPSLERTFIYTEKQNLNDFEIPEAALDELYELYVTTKDEVLSEQHTSVDFFNEVFYFLACAYINDTAAEKINDFLFGESGLYPLLPEYENPQTRAQANEAQEQYKRATNANVYVMSFVWVILTKQKELPKHVRFFRMALEHTLDIEYEDFNRYHGFVKKHPIKYSFPIPLTPSFDFGFCNRSAEEWYIATENFNWNYIQKIAQRFSVKDRIDLIKEMRKEVDEYYINLDNPNETTLRNQKWLDNRLDELLNKTEKEEAGYIQEKKEQTKSLELQIQELKDRIKDLEDENKNLKKEKETVERNVQRLQEELNRINNRLSQKHIPVSLKGEEAQLIINELIKNDIISPMGRHNVAGEFQTHFYRWDSSKALFGYFVDKMSFQLELYDSGGRINWKEFMPAFSNYEEIVKRARDTVSNYKQHPSAKMPEKAEIIDEAISNAEKILKERKNTTG